MCNIWKTETKGTIAAAIERRLQAMGTVDTTPSIPAKRKQVETKEVEYIDLTDDDPRETKRPRTDPQQLKTPPRTSASNKLTIVSPTFESPKSPVESLAPSPITPIGDSAPELTPLRLTIANRAYPDYAEKPQSPIQKPALKINTDAVEPPPLSPFEPTYARTSPTWPEFAGLTPNTLAAEHERLASGEVPPPSAVSRAYSPTSPTYTQPPPTPDATPQKPKKGMYSIPEIAPRYVARTSTAEGVEYTNPRKFTLKPAFWNKWTGGAYARFAEHLREQFNPAPFAVENDLSIDECKHVFNALVCNPLYFVVEARKRGEKGMQEIIELYNQYGTPTRPWGKGNAEEQVMGELSGVAAGSVELILQNGSKHEMKLDELSVVDVKYLKDTLTMEDKCILWESHGEMRGYGKDGLIL